MSKNDMKIGPKIVLDGEAEYKKAIKEVEKSMSVLASEAKKTAAAYADDKNSLEALRVQTEDYQSQAEKQREKVELLTAAYENSKKKNGENAEATKDWLIKLNNAEAALMKTENAIENNNQKIKEQKAVINQVKAKYEEWKDKIEDIKNAHPGMTKALETAHSAAKKLGGAGLTAIKGGATAAVTGATAVTAASVAMGKAVYDSASKTAEAGDRIDKLSQQLSLSREGFQEWEYVLSQSGVEIDSMTTGMKTLTNTLDDARKGSDTATEKFNRLGISVKELDGKSQDDVFASIITSLQKVEDETEKAALANDFFGKSGQNLLPLLNQSAESTQELIEKARDLGIVMSDESVNASVAFTDSLDSLNRIADATKNNISAKFLPGITDMMNGVTTFFSSSEGSMESSKELIKNGLWDIVENAEEALPELLGKFEGATEIIGDIVPTFIPFVVDTISESAPMLFDSAENILVTFAEGLLTEENMQKLSGTTVTLVSDVVGFVGDNADMMMDGATTLILSFVDSLLMPENSHKLVTGSLDVVTAIVGGLIENSPEMIAGGVELIGVLIDEIIHYDWWSVAKDIYAGIKDGFKNIFSGDSDGSHAGGIDYVPYDGYRMMAHKGEQLLTASEAVVYKQDKADNFSDYAELNRKVDALIAAQSKPVNWTMTANGSMGALVRVLNPAIARENKRSSAFK